MSLAGSSSMRVAITTPTTWPYVRRGAERFTNELAAYLGARGHRVTLISTKPGRTEVRRERGYTTLCHRRMWHPALARLGVLEFHPFLVTSLVSLLRGAYDVVLSATFVDAYAAAIARKVTGAGSVFWVNGLPPRIPYIRTATLRGAIFRRAMRQSDEVVSLSAYMQRELDARFGRAGTRIPVPVDTTSFPLSVRRDHVRPRIVCAAALDDRRKGGRLLLRAFDRLKATTHSSALLLLSSAVSNTTRQSLTECVSPRWRGDVQWLGAGELGDLPALFGGAAVSVLPSRWEPFGMITLESMATGTPVVATRDGAIPELIPDPALGRMFDPGPPTTPEPTNLEGLVTALREGLELSRDPDTAPRCRAHAEQFGWPVIGPVFERLLENVAARRSSSSSRLRAGLVGVEP